MSKTRSSKSTLGISIAATIGGICLAGCPSSPAPRYGAVTPQAAKQLEVTEVQLARVDPAFRKSVSDYAAQVVLVKDLKDKATNNDVQVAVGLLADAIERIPNAPDIDLALAAERIREPHRSMAATPPDDVHWTEANRKSLQAASTALGSVAGGPYRDDEEVQKEVTAFQETVREFAETGELQGRREKLVEALEDSRKAMEKMLAAAARRAQ